MSIFCSTGGLTAYRYQGSHHMPSRHDEKVGIDVAYPAAHIPTTLESARGITYVEARQFGTDPHPWLRFSIMEVGGGSFILDEKQAREFRDFLDDWLSTPKLKRVG